MITGQSLEDVHLVFFLERPLTSNATLEWSVAFLVTFHTELPAADDLLADDGVEAPLDLDDLPGATVRALPHLLCPGVTAGPQHVELDRLDGAPGGNEMEVGLQEVLDLLRSVVEAVAGLVEILGVNIWVDNTQ